MPFRFARPLPGEFEGKVDPTDYGFEVIQQPPITDEEAAQRIGAFYARAKALTGVVIPRLEPYLAQYVDKPAIESQ